MSREKYSGKERKLLLAIDVGTTYSGISYSILDPGKEPKIEGLTKFPGQEIAGGNAKIPSVMYYDKGGNVRAAGAETERDGMDIIAQEEGWDKTKWFKLHLRPKTKEFATGPAQIPDLPPSKTAVDVLADYLKYLNKCAKEFIEENHPFIGIDLWKEKEIHYLLSHPNGWEGHQQALMKQAAEKAGLITVGGRNKVTFLTEGEASLNRCIEKGLMNESIRKGEGVSIVDAGGGTLDISAYAAEPDGKSFEEIAEAQCHLKGSIFVTEAAGEYLKKFLAGSKFHRDIDRMKQCFDEKPKCMFRSPEDGCFVRFGGRETEAKYKITAGTLRLRGEDVAQFFEPSIKCIVDGVLEQRRKAHKTISTVFLVGGFSASDYLFNRVKEGLVPHGLQVFRPDTQVNKVVADGAVSFVLDHPVRARVVRHAFGTTVCVPFESQKAQHTKRKWECITLWTGDMAIPGGFSCILPKARNTQVTESKEYRSTYVRGAPNPAFLKRMESEIFRYRGNKPPKQCLFMDDDPNNFQEACTIKANLANIPISLCFGPRGIYYEIVIDIVLFFGGTELKAQIAWMEDDVEKRGDAEIIYDTDF